MYEILLLHFLFNRAIEGSRTQRFEDIRELEVKRHLISPLMLEQDLLMLPETSTFTPMQVSYMKYINNISLINLRIISC